MYKKTAFSVLLMLFTVALLDGQTSGKSAIEVIMSGYSAKMFTSEPVTDQQLDLIMKCGIKAPSARNSQNWRFTVIKDNDLVGEILRNPAPGNVAIIISGNEVQQPGMNLEFDIALATQNMYIAAQSLGLGAHIYGSPVANINSKKEIFGIPEGCRAVTVLRIGNIDKTVDAVSAASARKKLEEVVNYK
jgi:nitroreductase